MRDDEATRHARVSGEHGFDFAQLDTIAADFDLLVGAAQKFDDTFGRPACAVAGLEHSRTGGGIGDESFGSQFGSGDISQTDGHAGDVQIAVDADGQRPQRGVEYMHLRVGDWAADRDVSSLIIEQAFPMRDFNSGFCGPVKIDKTRGGQS